MHTGAPSEHEAGTCIVTIQYGDEDDACMVYLAECPPQGNFKSVIEALIMANNVHEKDAGSYKVKRWEVTRRVYGSLRSRTLEELANCGEGGSSSGY